MSTNAIDAWQHGSAADATLSSRLLSCTSHCPTVPLVVHQSFVPLLFVFLYRYLFHHPLVVPMVWSSIHRYFSTMQYTAICNTVHLYRGHITMKLTISFCFVDSEIIGAKSNINNMSPAVAKMAAQYRIFAFECGSLSLTHSFSAISENIAIIQFYILPKLDSLSYIFVADSIGLT